MDVRLLYFDDCPSWRVAEERLRAALDETGRADVPIKRELVTTIDEARRRHFPGSPTILIDGADPFAGAHDEPALACRVYASDQGLEGSPSVEQLIRAVAEAAH